MGLCLNFSTWHPGYLFFNKIPTTKGWHLGYFQRSGLDAGSFLGNVFRHKFSARDGQGDFFCGLKQLKLVKVVRMVSTFPENLGIQLCKKNIFLAVSLSQDSWNFLFLFKKWLKSINVKTQSLRDRPCLVLQPQPGRPLHHRNLYDINTYP